VTAAIDSLCAHLAPDQSPCLDLPDAAFADPRLLSQCPRCNSPVQFNPFFVDAVEDCPVRKPKSEWKRLSDLDPELVEFEHLMRAERFYDACRLLNEIDREYLAFWGQRTLVVELRTRLLGRIGDAGLQSLNYGNLGANYLEMGEGQKSAECLGQALAIALELGDRSLECRWMGNLGIALLAGDANDGRRKLEDALALANEIDDRLHIGRWTYALGNALGGDDVEASVQMCLTALAATREAHDRRFERYCLSSIGEGLVKLDSAAEATPYLREAVAVAETIGDTRGFFECLFALAGCHESAGDYESQAARLQQAADVARELGDRSAWERSIVRLRSAQKKLGCDVPEITRW
jgi:tetratricopeptide (TPR) repeat protein